MIKVKLRNELSQLWAVGQCWALPKAGRPFEMIADLADGPNLITTSMIVNVERNPQGDFLFITANSSYLLVILADTKESCHKKLAENVAGVSA